MRWWSEATRIFTYVGGAALTWPLRARAQQADRMRRVGVLLTSSADDPERQARVAAFRRTLQQVNRRAVGSMNEHRVEDNAV
jgi:hypothetical protein